MSPKVNLVALSASEVAANEDNYNSLFHNAEEAPNLSPDLPSELPTRFAEHLPLIMSSQNLPPSSLQIITLKPSLCRLLLQCSAASLHTRVLNRVYLSDLEDDLAPTFSSLVFPPSGLFLRFDACSPKDGEDGTRPLRTSEDIYLRVTTSYRACNSIQRFLDKQGENKKMLELFFLPFNTSMDTSLEYRVFCAPSPNSYWSPWSPASRKLQSNHQNETPEKACRYLGNCDEVTPPHISAISQYRWHEPSSLSGLLPTTSRVFQERIQLIANEAHRIHELIIEAALARMSERHSSRKKDVTSQREVKGIELSPRTGLNSEWPTGMDDGLKKVVEERDMDMDRLLFSQGFVFDIRYVPSASTANKKTDQEVNEVREAVEQRREGRCELIELNTFGTLSACGACLFHWLRDEDILYGLGNGKESTEKMTDSKDASQEMQIQFRISL